MNKILISGATKGLGRALAIELSKSGHQLILCSRSQESLKKLSSEIKEINPSLSPIVIAVDLQKQEELVKKLSQLSQENCPNIIINNLGIFENGLASEIKLNQLQSQLELNLYSAINITKLFLENIKTQKGQIINIGSVVSHQAAKEMASYSISKHALKAWNDSLREELRTKGVKVTAIYPGAMNTSSWDEVENVERQKMIQVEDVAKLVRQLIEIGESTLVEEIRLSPLNF